MMLRNLGRRYQPEAPVDVSKPESKASGAATKRRALGDITNASSTEETKDNATKKPTSRSIHVPEVKIQLQEEIVLKKDDDRDYMRRDSDDIDARDAGNPMLATCYVNEMYKNFIVLEKQYLPDSTYMDDQPYVNEKMRCILIDWLVCACFLSLKFLHLPACMCL